ncbi:hypothetical protein [Aggregatibacter kilianii]|uniref:hypothetical protein n=1 Tax=Aggregatibacter kilianii TaxID=2025884 RepID=UPI000D641EE1|nr:hypothetical protein [Aggregatibacter kilianii]
MPYIIAVLLGLLWVVMGFSQHYKNELQAKSAELVSVSQANARNVAMLANYQLQAAALSAQLNELNELAQSRQAQLDEVLTHEQNQTWTSQRVPDDINRLFEQRNAAPGKSAVNLPANNRMQGNQNPHTH